MAFWLAIYAIFFLERGLSYSEILILYAVLNGIQMILEIPSGALADRWGRRRVLMLGALVQAIGNLLIAFGNSLSPFVIGMGLNGAAMAFISGSDAAFIYDTLKFVGRENEFKRVEGHAYMFNLLGWGAAGLLGGILAVRDISVPFILTAFASLLAFLVMAICQEPPRLHHALEVPLHASGRLMAHAWRTVRQNRLIAAAVLFNAAIIGTLLIKHKFSQPYLLMAGVDLAYFGVVYFVWLIFAAAASHFSEKIDRRLGPATYFITLPILTGLVMIYLGFFQNWVGVALILLHQYVWGSLRPQINQIINRETPTAIRATVLSIAGFGASIVYIIGVPVFGLLADHYEFMLSLKWLGLVAMLLGLPAAWLLVNKLRAGSVDSI